MSNKTESAAVGSGSTASRGRKRAVVGRLTKTGAILDRETGGGSDGDPGSKAVAQDGSGLANAQRPVPICDAGTMTTAGGHSR